MPTQRKRIGFLPRQEVQSIIDQICKNNKLSQSKVTGILVEEALNSRGMLNSRLDNISIDEAIDYNESLIFNNDHFNSKEDMVNDNFYLDKDYINDEVQMINQFIEYRFFKNIMNKNKKNYKT